MQQHNNVCCPQSTLAIALFSAAEPAILLIRCYAALTFLSSLKIIICLCCLPKCLQSHTYWEECTRPSQSLAAVATAHAPKTCSSIDQKINQIIDQKIDQQLDQQIIDWKIDHIIDYFLSLFLSHLAFHSNRTRNEEKEDHCNL